MSKYFTVTGASFDSEVSELNAFDGALLQAGVGDMNLVKVSSILPVGFTYVDPRPLELERGTLLPIAYATLTSSVPGTLIAAAVAVGVEEIGGGGVIVEFSAVGQTRDQVRTQVQAMLMEAFRVRNRKLNYGWTFAIDHVVKTHGCVLACVPLWFDGMKSWGGVVSPE
jgi:arginine decarboxylase